MLILFLPKSRTTIAALEKKLNETKKPSGFTTKTAVKANADIIQGKCQYKKCCNDTSGRR